jgi:hypothetical protein
MLDESKIEGSSSMFCVNDIQGKLICVVVYTLMVYEYFMTIYFGVWH